MITKEKDQWFILYENGKPIKRVAIRKDEAGIMNKRLAGTGYVLNMERRKNDNRY